MPATENTLQRTLHSLYSDHHGWLLAWLRKRLGCAHNAADLAHDTFVRVLCRPQALAGIQEPRAYLVTVARGLVIDQARRHELERAYLESIAHLSPSEVPSPETQFLLLDALARIDALLDGLGPRVRTAFLMSRLEGLSYPEIARLMNVSLSTVEKCMAKAVRHCYQMRFAV